MWYSRILCRARYRYVNYCYIFYNVRCGCVYLQGGGCWYVWRGVEGVGEGWYGAGIGCNEGLVVRVGADIMCVL